MKWSEFMAVEQVISSDVNLHPTSQLTECWVQTERGLGINPILVFMTDWAGRHTD